MKGSSHPGFKAVQKKIEGEGYSKRAAGAILAHASRNASSSAKKANPRLNKVGGSSPSGEAQAEAMNHRLHGK